MEIGTSKGDAWATVEAQAESTVAPVEFAPAKLASAVVALAVEQMVASFLAHATARDITAASEEFCTERRWDATEPRSAVMASIPITTPQLTRTVTMMAAAPRSGRMDRRTRFNHRIA
ncbi:hypothetical protein [Terrabacter sp. Root181]|uniref:hypothetical protein n=1 Tax=Terrabacter sp. Root181 TaxID=1736484 RepID=UPI0006F3DCD7|nr:hypothetical protein [Terrabacter sp. Root181]KRB43863.1 hypothetical protein ASD90_19810 [Terrabacter sp. Root181]